MKTAYPSHTQPHMAAVAVADLLPLCQLLIKLPRAVEDTRSQRHAHAFPGKLHAHVNIHPGHAALSLPALGIPGPRALGTRRTFTVRFLQGCHPCALASLLRFSTPSRAHTHTPLCSVAADWSPVTCHLARGGAGTPWCSGPAAAVLERARGTEHPAPRTGRLGGPRARPRAAAASPRAADPARPTAFVLRRCQHWPSARCALAAWPGPTHRRPAATAAAAAVGRPAAAGPWCSVAARSRSAAAPGPASGARKAKSAARVRSVGLRTRHSRARSPNRCRGWLGGGALLRSRASHLHLGPRALHHPGDIPGKRVPHPLCCRPAPVTVKETEARVSRDLLEHVARGA